MFYPHTHKKYYYYYYYWCCGRWSTMKTLLFVAVEAIEAIEWNVYIWCGHFRIHTHLHLQPYGGMSTKITSFTNCVIWCGPLFVLGTEMVGRSFRRSVGRCSVMDWKHTDQSIWMCCRRIEDRRRTKKKITKIVSRKKINRSFVSIDGFYVHRLQLNFLHRTPDKMFKFLHRSSNSSETFSHHVFPSFSLLFCFRLVSVFLLLLLLLLLHKKIEMWFIRRLKNLTNISSVTHHNSCKDANAHTHTRTHKTKKHKLKYLHGKYVAKPPEKPSRNFTVVRLRSNGWLGDSALTLWISADIYTHAPHTPLFRPTKWCAYFRVYRPVLRYSYTSAYHARARTHNHLHLFVVIFLSYLFSSRPLVRLHNFPFYILTFISI